MKLIDILGKVQTSELFFKDAELQIKQVLIERINTMPGFQQGVDLIRKNDVLTMIGEL